MPAVVQQTQEESAVDEPLLRDINLTDCRRSLFERLLAQFKTADGYDPRYVYMLTRQGRMHQTIAEFANYAFYGNRLEVVPLQHQTLPYSPSCSTNGIAQLLSMRRVAFVSAPKPRTSASVKTNHVEAEMIAATVVEIYRQTKEWFDENQTVGVIVPYRNQIATVRSAIDQHGIDVLHNITIDTVERYQGSQRDYIIYGFTVQQYNQLNFLTNNVFVEDGMVIDRKLNVAMTRARLQLLMVGNADILMENFTFYKLLMYLKEKNCFFDIPPTEYCKGKFKVEELKETTASNGLLQLGEDFEKTIINYGRLEFDTPQTAYNRQTDKAVIVSAEEQVRMYCHYYMPQYLKEAECVWRKKHQSIMKMAESCGKQVVMIDIGCGPATYGIAFAQHFAAEMNKIEYVGVDTSEEMLRMGERLFDERRLCEHEHNEKPWANVEQRFTSSLDEAAESLMLDDEADKKSQPSRLVVFNIAHLFACIDGNMAETLAMKINSIIQRYTQNKYTVIVTENEFDRRMRSYGVFRRCVKN